MDHCWAEGQGGDRIFWDANSGVRLLKHSA